MDAKNEDTLVRQIEKNLSNNINENLFSSSRGLENHVLTKRNFDQPKNYDKQKPNGASENEDYPLISYDNINDTPVSISRAEYIRQAREACLRQLSNTQTYCRPYDSNYMEGETIDPEQLSNKKTKMKRMLLNGSMETAAGGEDSPQEIADFRGLIIRTVCAIVLFLLVFVIDKFQIVIGKITPNLIQAYVTGNDKFQQLENIVVTWLK